MNNNYLQTLSCAILFLFGLMALSSPDSGATDKEVLALMAQCRIALQGAQNETSPSPAVTELMRRIEELLDAIELPPVEIVSGGQTGGLGFAASTGIEPLIREKLGSLRKEPKTDYYAITLRDRLALTPVLEALADRFDVSKQDLFIAILELGVEAWQQPDHHLHFRMLDSVQTSLRSAEGSHIPSSLKIPRRLYDQCSELSKRDIGTNKFNAFAVAALYFAVSQLEEDPTMASANHGAVDHRPQLSSADSVDSPVLFRELGIAAHIVVLTFLSSRPNYGYGINQAAAKLNFIFGETFVSETLQSLQTQRLVRELTTTEAKSLGLALNAGTSNIRRIYFQITSEGQVELLRLRKNISEFFGNGAASIELETPTSFQEFGLGAAPAILAVLEAGHRHTARIIEALKERNIDTNQGTLSVFLNKLSKDGLVRKLTKEQVLIEELALDTGPGGENSRIYFQITPEGVVRSQLYRENILLFLRLTQPLMGLP